MIYNIETGNNNKILRKISDKIEICDIKKFSKIGEDMIKMIKDPNTNGVGLAAPQIGINKRLICISLLKTYDDDSFKTIYMINPEIISFSEECEIDNEGCLSVPKKFGDVKRAKNIKIKYVDSKGKDNILILSGISARIAQHEIDHLDGILFTDKIISIEENQI